MSSGERILLRSLRQAASGAAGAYGVDRVEEEEASVRKDGGDVGEFHSRRLATFGTCSRS
jgi:hypothetical protein